VRAGAARVILLDPGARAGRSPGIGTVCSTKEHAMASNRQYERMAWRAAGAQFYPGGAYDALQELTHRGRGPKGYRRTDERLKEIICERLTEDPFIDASDITVDVANGAVTLQGSVLARPQKHAAEDLAAEVSGVTEIHNELRIGSDDIEARTSGL
jgi:osmotically-inducible protein OsmY